MPLPCAPVKIRRIPVALAELRGVPRARRVHICAHASGGGALRADRGANIRPMGATAVRPARGQRGHNLRLLSAHSGDFRFLFARDLIESVHSVYLRTYCKSIGR